MTAKQEKDSNWIPSFYRHSKVTGKYSVIDHPEKKNEILYMDYDGTHHVRIMKSFQTPDDPDILDTEEKAALRIGGQKDFFLRCYLPKNKISHKNKQQRIKHLIVMFNGLNECAKYDFYDFLGAQFAEHGFASILLPTPYHLDRRIGRTKNSKPRSMKEANTKDYELPTDMAFDRPELYFYNFKRSIREFEELIRRIETPDEKDYGFFKNYFVENPEITIFGFSLGGLRALACFLRKPAKYHSCITFNSGFNLRKINTEGLHLDAKSWKKTFVDITRLVDSMKFLNAQTDMKIVDFFRGLYLGRDDIEDLIASLEKHSHKYLSIQSGADTLFENTRQWDANIARPGHGLNRLTIAGVGHVPTMDLRWDNWLSRVAESIVYFIQGAKDVHWAHAELETKIKELIEATPFFKKIKARTKRNNNYFIKFDFSFAVFEELKKQIKNNGKNAEKFEEFYYISKAFYPKFSELLEKVTKQQLKEEELKDNKKNK